MIKFVASISVFTIVIVGIALGLSQLESPQLVHPLWWTICVFYYLLSIGLHLIAVFGKKLGSDSFVQFFLLTVGIRLFLSLGFITIFIVQNVPHRLLFVSDFFVFYLLYTGFDVIALIPNLRPQSKRQ